MKWKRQLLAFQIGRLRALFDEFHCFRTIKKLREWNVDIPLSTIRRTIHHNEEKDSWDRKFGWGSKKKKKKITSQVKMHKKKKWLKWLRLTGVRQRHFCWGFLIENLIRIKRPFDTMSAYIFFLHGKYDFFFYFWKENEKKKRNRFCICFIYFIGFVYISAGYYGNGIENNLTIEMNHKWLPFILECIFIF